jgi:DNA mismatch repair protein MutS2
LLNEIGTIQSSLNKETPSKTISLDVDPKYSHFRPISFEDIQINMTVFSVNIKKNVKVVQLNTRRKEIQIQHGALSVWVTTESIRWPSGAKPTTPSVRINIERTVKGDIEIDCRGMRLEEFQKSCEQAIDEVFSGEIPFVTIIHGHGNGILKNWLRNYLKKEYKELHFENIEGNDGCTKISFPT